MSIPFAKRKKGRPRKRKAAQLAAAAIARGEYRTVSEAAHAFVGLHAPRLRNETSESHRKEEIFWKFREYIIEELESAKGGMNGFYILADVHKNIVSQPLGKKREEDRKGKIAMEELRSSISDILEIEGAWKNSSAYLLSRNK